jgi:spectinomycin phosphotransferase
VDAFASAAGAPIIDRAAVVARLRADFGVSVHSISQVSGGQDSEAVVMRAVTVDGAEFAVKVSRSLGVGGLLASAFLARRVSSGIAGPLLARSGQPFSVVDGRRLSVSPWVSGRGAYETGMDAPQWRSFGSVLAEVHDVQLPRAAADQLPTEDYRTPAAASTRVLDERIRAEVRRHPAGSDASPTGALIREWHAATGSVGAILTHIDDLGDELRACTRPSVICHGDAHIGNVQLSDDGGIWLLDWDEVVCAPRERDLMFVLGGVLAHAPVSTRQQGWFFEGYGPADIAPVQLAYYRCSWALQDIADYAGRVLDQPAMSSGAGSQALELFCDLLSPTGIVRLAVDSLQEIGRDVSVAGSRRGGRP